MQPGHLCGRDTESDAALIRGAITVVLLALNTLFWGILVTFLGIVKLLAPTPETRRRIRLALTGLGDRWAGGNNVIFDAMLNTKWDIAGVDGLSPDGHYLIISNHISSLDIFVVFRAFHGRVAFIRFFLKRNLIWVPIVGQACWAMDFPFMRRYTAEYLERHPEKRGRDLEATRLTCRRYRRIPVAILNFLEGTRFTAEKHDEQASPYRHLLRPRIGGTAFVLSSLGEHLDSVIDVTIAYPTRDVTMWQFLTNQVDRIVLRARVLDVPPQFLSDPITEPGPARDAFREWIEGVWREKDDLAGQLRTVVH
jgi:1-acyl-sn-glycerol-3-phosphate acyltransferase